MYAILIICLLSVEIMFGASLDPKSAQISPFSGEIAKMCRGGQQESCNQLSSGEKIQSIICSNGAQVFEHIKASGDIKIDITYANNDRAYVTELSSGYQKEKFTYADGMVMTSIKKASGAISKDIKNSKGEVVGFYTVEASGKKSHRGLGDYDITTFPFQPRTSKNNNNNSRGNISVGANGVNQQNIQTSVPVQTSTPITDKKFDKPNKDRENKRDQQIEQNNQIKARINSINKGNLGFKTIEEDPSFIKTEKSNVIFLERQGKKNDKNSNTNELMGDIIRLGAAISINSSIGIIKSYFESSAYDLTQFNLDNNLSAAGCFKTIKDEKMQSSYFSKYKETLEHIVCLNDNVLTSQCEYIEWFYRIQRLKESGQCVFALYVKNDDSTIQSYVIKHNKRIAIISGCETSDEFKNFINSCFDLDTLGRYIAELEMKATENWSCSREILNALGIKKDIIDDVEKQYKSLVKESLKPQVKKQEPDKPQIATEIQRDYIAEIKTMFEGFFKRYPKICIGAAISFVVILYFIIGSSGSSLNISSMSNFHPAISMTSTGMSLYNSHTGMNISMKY